MNRPAKHTDHIPSSEVTLIQSDHEMAEKLLHDTQLDKALRHFALQTPLHETGDPLRESDIEVLLREFTDRLTTFATWEGRVNSDQIKAGFDLVAETMNRIAREKLDKKPEEKRWLRLLPLTRELANEHERRVVVGFTEEEWDRQFREPLEAMSAHPSKRDELNEFVFETFKGFAFSHFSSVPQAVRWA